MSSGGHESFCPGRESGHKAQCPQEDHVILGLLVRGRKSAFDSMCRRKRKESFKQADDLMDLF